MTAARTYRGLPVSEGIAAGETLRVDEPAVVVGGDAAGTDIETVRAAFAAVAADRTRLAADLRARGADLEAGIIEIGALIAVDPALTGPALDALAAGADAVTAVTGAAEAQAAVLAALPDPDLAQRAGDVRQVAAAVLAELRRRARGGPRTMRPDASGPETTASGTTGPGRPRGPVILIQRDVDPADLIRLADAGEPVLAGAVSVGGGASSHAAIVARGLGLPMLAGADPAVLDAPAGHPAILDADAGKLIVDPAPADRARTAPSRAANSGAAAGAGVAGTAAVSSLLRPAGGVVRTADGEQVTLLCNVASAAETRLGLSGGAAGVGLLRTEIAFTGTGGWPSEDDHLAQLGPVLRELAGHSAVIRLLDFSGDKVPPFLRAGSQHGLTALLAAPGALDAQLRAIIRAGRESRAHVSVMIPMVSSVDEISQVRERLTAIAARTRVPPLGIMVEVISTAANAAEFAKAADFFSIGTNDLTSEVLGIDRADPAIGPALAADPRVLGLIGNVVTAGRQAGISVSVCGDAAADPHVLPRLLRLGVRTLSVGAARVPRVAAWIAATDTAATDNIATDGTGNDRAAS